MISKQENKNSFFFRLLFFLIFLYSFNLWAQNSEEYNRVYTKTYLEVSQKDFKKALNIADSLFITSETPSFKAKSLMLSATLYQQSGDIKKAVDYAVKAEHTINDTDDFTWKAKIFGFLSTQYRNLGLFNQSKNYIDKSLKAIAGINDSKVANQMMGFVMQEQAYYEMDIKNYNRSISFVKKSQKYFDTAGQHNSFLTAGNDQLLGLNYYYQKEFDKALLYYNKALDELISIPDNFLKGLVFNGMAQVYIEKKDVKKAKEYLQHAQKIAEQSNYLNLKNEIFKTSQKYYILTKNVEKLQEIKIKQDSVTENIEKKSLIFINDSYNGLEKKNEIVKQQAQKKNVIIIICILILLLGAVYFFVYRNIQKKNLQKIKKILEELDENKKNLHENALKTENSDKEAVLDNDNIKGVEQQTMMTLVTEKKLLIKLERFEQSTLYTRNTISLPYLASYFKTNTKYLSYIIKTYRGKDFKNYINELRVKYIIEKLKNDPQYQKYKISTLSEEAGFSSQSKFASAFKKVTAVSPSEFLNHIKKLQ